MSFPAPRQIVDDIALCFVFFTRLPLPRLDFNGRTLAGAIWAAPIAGLAVGLIGAIVYAVAFLFGLSGGVAAALALAAMMLATGCLHEDGLSDVADGFGGGATRERKLEIMRDSRIGAYGACALLMSALIRWSAISDLASPVHVFCGLIAAHAASRALLPAFMLSLAPARFDGLAQGAGRVSSGAAVAAALLGLAALLALGLGGATAATLCLALVFAGFWYLCLTQIGGQTGDTLGALQQAGEITILLVAAVFL